MGKKTDPKPDAATDEGAQDMTLTMTSETQTAAVKHDTLLAILAGLIAQAEAAGDHATAGVLHNVAQHASEFKHHLADALPKVTGDAAEALSFFAERL
jgi:hypothetical protein